MEKMNNNKNLNGIVLIDKPAGTSSNTIVNIVKRILSVKKAGHTGTLDPFATGLLPVCLNKGTKLVRYLMGKDKEYIGLIKLGVKTDTLDKTGEIISEMDVPDLSQEDIKKACEKFTGEISQVPPAFSALKYKGVPLYKYARKGEFIEKPPRDVTIHNLEILNIDLPYIEIKVKCSAGTYIRTLASDIAEELDTCGHLEELRRTACGELEIEKGLTPDELKEVENPEELIISLEELTSFMPEIIIKNAMIPDVRNGKKINTEIIANKKDIIEDIPMRLISEDKELISIVRIEKNSTFFKYDVVFN